MRPLSQSKERILNSIKLEKPDIALRLRPVIEQQIEKENFTFLKNYVPLYWAQSYLQLNEIEESIRQIREFFARSTPMQSPEVLARVYIHLRDMRRLVIRIFRLCGSFGKRWKPILISWRRL